MATTLEIIDCISQVLSNTYDGALDESGEPIKIGLRREEGNPLVDHRVMDGFGANISGDRLHVQRTSSHNSGGDTHGNISINESNHPFRALDTPA